MTRSQRLARWGFLALAGATLASGATAQTPSPAGSGLPKGFENRAGSYVAQVRQLVRSMDQNISRILTQDNKAQTGKIQTGAPDPTEQNPQLQNVRNAYLEQRDKVLAMLKEAEQLPSPTMSTKTRIDAAEQVLEARYEEVIAALK